nr:cullin, conserved site-containing protein [Tanacetum cinerariifolium]
MMGDVELEEGEACCDYNIDQRIEDVLGAFQKDFEGLVTTKSLGPVGGFYGSFLPMYKHPPPITSQTKPLQIVPNFSTRRAPNNHRLEGALLTPVTPVSLIRPAVVSDRKDVVPSQNTLPVNVSAIKNASKNEATTSNVANPSEQNSLRLRIKVGPDKPVRKNYEIYSGLGLLLSPSSSTGNDSEDIGGSTIESPGCVLRDMTSIFVPHDRLVSPLNESLLCLTKADRILETQVALPVNQFVDASSSRHEEVKQIEVKEVNSRVKCEVPDGIQNEGPFLEKCVGTVSFDSKRDLTNESQGKLSKVSVTVKADKEAKKNIVPVKKRETKGECVKDELFCPDFTRKESRESVKRSSIEHNEETSPMVVFKGLSLDSKRSSKGSTVLSVCKTEPEVSKHTTVHSEKKVGRKVSQGIDELPSERKNKLTGVQSTGISSSELVKLKSRSRLSLGAINDKSGIKGIVRARNSYKDLFDTEVEDQNKQEKLLESPTRNGVVNHSDIRAVNRKNVERNESYAVVSDAQQTEVDPAEAASHDNWVACDRCNAWRLLPIGITTADLPEKWWCSKSTWLPGKNYCDVNTYHTNSNANSDTMPNGWKKNKSRPEGSNSSQVETSHSSMDSRQKRKRLSEANQQLLEKNVVNKPIDVGRNDATVNGELRPKKLKTMTGLDQHDHLTSTKIKNENERQTENTRASLKSKLLDRKSCEEVEMSAKKRKLKDQEDTPPYANTVKEKRLKTSNTDINGEEKPLIKGNGMKIKLSVSRESSVDKSHEKNLNATSSRKDLESERFQFGATSSSSKVFGSFRRASLQEVKASPVGSPVGSVSSSLLKAPNRDKVTPAGRTISRKAHAKSSIRPEVPRKLLARGDNMQSRDIDASQSQKICGTFELKRKEASKFTGTTSTQKSGKGSLLMSKDCGIVKDLSVVCFLKEYASSQTAMTAFKKAEESKDYAYRLKIFGFGYECNDAYFDSALKFLHAASLLEAYYNDFRKLKGMVDPSSVYSTAAKLSKICAEGYEKRKEMAAAALAYKCMEVACMRVVYCKSFMTKQDLQMSMQMVTQGESPSSSASDVDNLNNQATMMDKTMLSKNITHLGNQVVARSQANFTRLLDFTGDVSLAMEASLNTQDAYKAASTTLEESQNKEMTVSVKRVVDFSFQDVKEFVTLVQNAREAINRQGFKGNDTQQSCK